MAKIAIISDVHLGTRQYGLKERYEDFLLAFRRFGISVATHQPIIPDMVVIGGDLFDAPRPDAKSVRTAQEVVELIKDAGIEVYGIDGNHDLADNYWLDVIGAHPLETGMPEAWCGMKIVGINYRNGRDFIAAINEMIDRGEKADILVAHFALAELNGGGTADTGVQELCPLLEKLGVKCVLMGHVHIPEAKKWNGILFVNPGSTEMKSANEPEEKYYFVVDTDTWEAEPVRITTRKVVHLEIENETNLTEVMQMLSEENSRNLDPNDRSFFQIIADDSVEDVFKRLSQTIHDTGSMARIVMRSSKSRDLAPVVDRKEGVATLASAVEARFPNESQEARLTMDFLHSPDPAAIRMRCERFMKEE
jgi:DNA repair exonuclease SbcCD nuclease subunit